MFRSQAAVVFAATLAVAPQVAAQSARWIEAKCDIKPAHVLVNSGLNYLKSAANTRFEDQKQKDLRDASRVLNQALTTGNQEKNPAAWYYLGRYYLTVGDMAGADSALTRAEALKPECKDDIGNWRRSMWRDVMNVGVAAWQASNTDSAIAAFRRANAILQTEPQGFTYLATLHFNGGQRDSAVHYFRRAADVAAKDPKYAQERKDALYNLARIEHSLQHLPQAEAAYREYLSIYPTDAEVQASLGSVLNQRGQRDSAFAIYRQIIARSDSADGMALFRAGVEIYESAPERPDTAAAGRTCRAQGQTGRQATPPARVRACRDSMATLMRDYHAAAKAGFLLAAQAFEASLKINPYYRDGLFNVVNTYLTLNDSAAMLAPAQRLVVIDPLNRMSLRLLAFAHQRLGRVDSTVHYLRMADSLLIADVTITQFDPTDEGAVIRGIVTNLRTAGGSPFQLTFEFVNAKGEVVTTQTADIPALEPQQTHALAMKVTGPGIAAWRYRKA